MSDYLTHLRFVHNVQTIICLTIIYFVWSSWTSGTELLGELNRFLQTSALGPRSCRIAPGTLAICYPAC